MSSNLSPSIKNPDEFHRKVLDETADAIVSVDLDQRIVFFNKAAQEMFGYDAKDVLGKPLALLIPFRFRSEHPGKFTEFAQGGEKARYMGDRGGHIIGLHADGTELMLGSSLVRVEVGDQTFFTAIIRDVSSRVGLLSQMAELANTDPLTGIANRRFFLEAAKKESQRATRFHSVFSILIMDLDHFKRVNDEHGHDAGDKILCNFCGLAKRSLRSIDTFARWGGEEFIALLPKTDITGAKTTAERIREEVADHRFFVSDGDQVSITVSIGVSNSTNENKDIDEIIKGADEALYTAKSSGRNRVACKLEKANL